MVSILCCASSRVAKTSARLRGPTTRGPVSVTSAGRNGLLSQPKLRLSDCLTTNPTTHLGPHWSSFWRIALFGGAAVGAGGQFHGRRYECPAVSKPVRVAYHSRTQTGCSTPSTVVPDSASTSAWHIRALAATFRHDCPNVFRVSLPRNKIVEDFDCASSTGPCGSGIRPPG